MAIDFLGSLAKNYEKYDPFGARHGFRCKLREVTLICKKIRDYYLGVLIKKNITPLYDCHDKFPNPTQVGKYDEPGEILAMLLEN